MLRHWNFRKLYLDTEPFIGHEKKIKQPLTYYHILQVMYKLS